MEKLNQPKQACLVSLLLVISSVAVSAQTFTTLNSFDNVDGAQPESALVQATDGNLYGVALAGGTYQGGTVFKINSTSGALTVLHSFQGVTDGWQPVGALVQAGDGSFYGATTSGPDGSCPKVSDVGCGTIFKITLSGTLTTLYTFCSQTGCADGAFPNGGLVQGADGNLYGTTVIGGANPCGFLDTPDAGCGTVFRITPAGKLTTLYSFCSQDGCADGLNPYAGLVQGVDGSFYGTTFLGGVNNNCVEMYSSSCGTIFRVTPKGAVTVLYNFCSKSNCADGALPLYGLVQASDGNLYGSTFAGGANGFGDGALGDGSLFRITTTGTLTTLHSFCTESGCKDGAASGPLVRANDGDLYGAGAGGANFNGEVFRLNLNGALTTVYSFCDPYNDSRCTAGVGSQALIQDTNGRFYATTNYGGTSDACEYGCGTVFSLGIGLRPFVETQPGTAKVGKPIYILGSSLKGATAVTFNGVAATFTVESPSLIRATVPEGATTGPVLVTTPQETLKSNLPFRVIQ